MNCLPDFTDLICRALTTIRLGDFISFITLIVGIITFWKKFDADARAAKYRETIGFIDRNDSKLSEAWRGLKNSTSNDEGFGAKIRTMFNLLDTAALLINKKAFDGELIYNHWWHYFKFPMENDEIKAWVTKQRQEDKTVLEHYISLRGKWIARIEKEHV